MLVTFHKHATDIYILDGTARHPYTIGSPVIPGVSVDIAGAAMSKPPSISAVRCAASMWIVVVVALWRTESRSVGHKNRITCGRHSISGVSAVPVHRQPVLVSLITDGERQ